MRARRFLLVFAVVTLTVAAFKTALMYRMEGGPQDVSVASTGEGLDQPIVAIDTAITPVQGLAENAGFDASEGVAIAQVALQSDADSSQSDYLGTQQESGVYEEDPLANLLATIDRLSEDAGGSVLISAKTEQAVIDHLETSPELSNSLLRLLPRIQSVDERQLLVAILATVQSNEIEQYALELLRHPDRKGQSDWLSLLRDRGVKTHEGRELMLSRLPQLHNDGDVESALKSLEPTPVSITERQAIAATLEHYVRSDTAGVRRAAIESLIKWDGKTHTSLINEALFDASSEVRTSTLFAIGQSTIIDPDIKQSLVKIMSNDEEKWNFRLQAYDALNAYTLVGDEYEKFYQFDSLLRGGDGGDPSG